MTGSAPTLLIGSAVVYEHDPGLRGQIVGGPRGTDARPKWRVQWSDGKTGWVQEYELQPAPAVPPDAYDLLQARRFCGHSDLVRTVVFSQITGRLSNLVYSMDATNTDFYPYQYKPVLTFLESPSNGILIADEVGLGKTIEAGLIWTELRARYDARRLLVVCPAMLRDKWAYELEYRFSVQARILDANDLLRELEKPTLRRAQAQAFICSIQGLRPPRRYHDASDPDHQSPSAALARLLEDRIGDEPLFDLFVIDEAHYLRNPTTQSAVLGRLLRDVSEYVVPLSATPVNNKNEDLFQLLRLVDPDTFSSPDVFPAILEANEPLVRAHQLVFSPDSTADEIVKELRAASKHQLLRNSKILAAILSAVDEQDLNDHANRVELANRIGQVNLLGYVVSRTRKREVHELCVVRRAHSRKVEMPPGGVEEDFYRKVTAAVRSYAHARDGGAGFLLSLPQQMMSSCMYAAAKRWAGRYSVDDMGQIAYETIGDAPDHRDAASEDDIQPLIAHIVVEVLADFDYETLQDADSKFNAFYQWLYDFVNKHSNDKILVFSYFKDTLTYLSTRLQEKNLKTQVLHGDTKENKQVAINRFRTSRDVRILLASEVASEGVDLQFSRCIINYDLPWNPMKIEQRIGRIDRIGQESDSIQIVNFMYANTVDDRIYTRLLEKLGIFERALGGLEAILGEQVRRLTADLMTSDLTPEEQEERISQTAIAIENKRAEQEQLEEKAAHLMAHEDRILDSVRAARRLRRRITSSDLKEYARDYLHRQWSGSGFVFRESRRDSHIVEIMLPAALRARLLEYVRTQQLSSGTALTEGRYASYVFSQKIAGVSNSHERITQFHPLIRFIGDELAKTAAEFCPLVAVQMSPDRGGEWSEGIYVFVLQRWHFHGSRHVEEMRARAMSLDNGALLDLDRSLDLVSAAKVHGEDWHSARTVLSVEEAKNAIERTETQLQLDYERARRDRENANNDRVDVQTQSLKAQMKRQTENRERLLERYRKEARDRLVGMTEGRLRKMRADFETQIQRRELGRKHRASKGDLCMGVILVGRS